MLRCSHGDATGTELGSSSIKRASVNVGTVTSLALGHASSVANRLGPSSTDRVGTGRSRRSTPSRGEPVHMGKGGSSFEKQRRL